MTTRKHTTIRVEKGALMRSELGSYAVDLDPETGVVDVYRIRRADKRVWVTSGTWCGEHVVVLRD